MYLSKLSSRSVKRSVKRVRSLVRPGRSSIAMPKQHIREAPRPTMVVTAVRFYARRTTRTQVAEQTQTQQDYQTGLQPQTGNQTVQQQQQQQQYDQQQQQAYAADENVTTEETITPEIRRHMTKVYGTMTAGLGLAAGGALVGGLMPGIAIVGTLGSLIGILGVAFTDRSKVALRQNLFLGTAALVGLGISPLIAASSLGVVTAAALGTSAIFGGFTLAALRAKSNSMLTFGGPLLGGLLMLMACGLAGLILPLVGVTNPAILGALYNINLYGGLMLFSFYISYDTQRMIADYRAGDTDHVSPALSMFLNIINIFIRLLRIFRD